MEDFMIYNSLVYDTVRKIANWFEEKQLEFSFINPAIPYQSQKP